MHTAALASAPFVGKLSVLVDPGASAFGVATLPGSSKQPGANL